jgi:hypothetical protein
LIVPGYPVVYLLSRRLHDQYDAHNSQEIESEPHVVGYGKNLVPGVDIVPVTDQYTGVGDAVALGKLMEMFGAMGKPNQVRFGNDISFADLRNSPAVLIGFSNRWSVDVSRELRFNFVVQDHAKMIIDRRVPSQVWHTDMDPSGHTKMDYALISRVFDTTTGFPEVQAGGNTQYGTQAAGEFLTNGAYWQPLLDRAPKDWDTKNLQIVIRARVVGNTPGRPEVVAVHCW